MSLHELEGLIAAGRVHRGTLVWTPGLSAWTEAGRIAVLWEAGGARGERVQ